MLVLCNSLCMVAFGGVSIMFWRNDSDATYGLIFSFFFSVQGKCCNVLCVSLRLEGMGRIKLDETSNLNLVIILPDH